jgi:ligand-binding sensor domain-containing protein
MRRVLQLILAIHRRRSRRLTAKIVLAMKSLPILFLLAAAPLMALDPQTKITDLAHTKWSGGETPFTEVHDLAQTKDGTLWLASNQGLFSFDGVRFTRMEALSRTSIRHILATRDGSLWAVFDSGRVSRLSGGNITTFPLQELPQANALAEDRDGSLVAATANGGLARFRDGRWQEIGRALHHSAKRSYYVWFDRDGVLWLITEDRALKLAPGADHFTDPGIPMRLASSNGHFFAQSPDGNVWLANSDSVHSVNANGPRIEVKPAPLAAMVDRQGSLWVGTFGGGLWRVPVPATISGKGVAAIDSQSERFTIREGLSGDTVSCVMEDREGNVWVGTNQGLDRFRESVFHRVAFPDAERIYFMWDSSRDGGILIRTADPPKLAHLAPNGKITMLRLPVLNATDCYESDGTIWVGTPYGVGKWTGKGIAYSLRLRNSYIQRLGCGHGDLWIASPTQGVMRFSGGKLINIPQLRSNVFNFYPKGPGLVWIAYADGRISVYDNGVIHEYGKNDGVPEGATYNIIAKRDGELWIAGEGGLARFKDGRFQLVDVAQGLRVEALKRGENGTLWLRAGGVLMRMPIPEFDRAVADPGYKPRMERYGALDGIPGVVKVIAGSPHRLWVATSDGLGYLNLDPHASKNDLPPPVQIETVIADGKAMAASEGIVLPRLTHNLQIDYTAFSLTIPERVQFRYKLEGVDKDWQEANTRRQAYYTDLAPKKYRFIVKACNNDGVWNEKGAALDFSVDPAYLSDTLVSDCLPCGFSGGVLAPISLAATPSCAPIQHAPGRTNLRADAHSSRFARHAAAEFSGLPFRVSGGPQAPLA